MITFSVRYVLVRYIDLDIAFSMNIYIHIHNHNYSIFIVVIEIFLNRKERGWNQVYGISYR